MNVSFKTLIIALSTDRVDVLGVRGSRVQAARRLPLSLPNDPTEWMRTIRGLSERIRRAAEEIRFAGASARVLYSSPTLAVEQVSVDVARAADAEQAALMSGTDSLPYAAAAATSRVVFIARDGSNIAKPERHYIVMADRDDVVDALVTMTRSAGLRFVSATPIDAAVINRVIRDLLAIREPVGGRIFIGRHSSFFAIASKQSLRFSRRIPLGLESLISALKRPVHGAAEDVELSREQAESILHELGIPDPDRPEGWPEHLGPRVALPLLQPVLQRFLVEIRQSIRFSIEDDQRDQLAITMCGPGASIRGLSGLFATELAVKVHTDGGGESYDPAKADAPASEPVQALKDTTFLNVAGLLPRQVADQRRISRASRWLWAGAAAAIAVVLADGFMYASQIEHARQEVQVRKTENSEQIMLQATRKAVAESAVALRSLENVIDREIGARPRLGALMRELTLVCPANIRLTSVAARRTKENLIEGRLTGYCFQDAENTPPMGLDAFVGQLNASPLLDLVALKNVQITSIDAKDAQQFDIAFTIVSLPASGQADQMAASREDRP